MHRPAGPPWPCRLWLVCLGVFVKQEWGDISCIPTPIAFGGKRAPLWKQPEALWSLGWRVGGLAWGRDKEMPSLRKRQAPSLSGPSLSPPDPGTGPSW